VEIDGRLIPFLNSSDGAGAADGGAGSSAGGDAAAPTATDAAVVVVDPVAPVSHDGWTFDESTSPPTVVLQGQPCDDMLANGAQSVNIVFGCPRVEIDIR
jgi:hypothetical protein